MELKHLIFTGDMHGGFATITRISNIQQNIPDYKPEETMIVILGDAGLNFWLNNTDKKYKKLLNSMNYHIYCVRGNHEQRPELIKNMVLVNDENVAAEVEELGVELLGREHVLTNQPRNMLGDDFAEYLKEKLYQR